MELLIDSKLVWWPKNIPNSLKLTILKPFHLLAYAVSKNLLIHQMDVVTAFLNGSLEEELFMEQPPSYVKKGQENMVCTGSTDRQCY